MMSRTFYIDSDLVGSWFTSRRRLLSTALMALATVITLACPQLVASAEAARGPDDAERAAIAQQLGLAPECAEIMISTVDPTWAEAHSTNTASCLQGNGYVVLRLDELGWSKYHEGSGETCPMEGLPTSITADLGLCPAISSLPYVYDFMKFRLAIKPHAFGQGAHGGYRNLRWSKWGNTEALARAKFDYSDAYLRFRIPVKIRLYRAIRCENGLRLFTRRRVTAVHQRDRKRISFDARFTKYGSCAENQYTPIP